MAGLVSSDELQWTNGLATGLSTGSGAVGQRVAQDLLPDLSADTISLFVFPDGLTNNLEHFFAGLQDAVTRPKAARAKISPHFTCPVLGGSFAGASVFAPTFIGS
jgi:hypothetical protein